MTPTPFHVVRNHAKPVHHIVFSTDGRYLYSGDEDGNVAITDLDVRRVVAFWKAHENGVLAVGEWEGGLVSHGRDNLIHLHETLQAISTSSGSQVSAALTPLLTPPAIKQSLDVNSLNFCRFSLVHVRHNAAAGPSGTSKGKDKEVAVDEDGAVEGLIAVPNLTDSETVDIYHLPSLKRLHAAVCQQSKSARRPASDNPTAPERSGLIMSIQMYFACDDVSARAQLGTEPGIAQSRTLRLVVAFEDGRVELWQCDPESTGSGCEADEVWRRPTDSRLLDSGSSAQVNEGVVWRRLWREKVHNEAIMAMTVSPRHDYAFSISADHQLVRYALNDLPGGESRTKVVSTKQIGNSALAVMRDGRVVAVGGWDGSVRLFSTKSLKSLGALSYHRQSCDAISFAPGSTAGQLHGDDGDTVVAYDGIAESRERWMATCSKDRRVALWELKDFARK